MDWQVQSTAEYDAWFDDLADDEKVQVLRKVALLVMNGPSLPRPHADTLGGSKFPNMKELRAHTNSAQLRIAFAFDPTRVAVLLIGGQKQGVNQKRFYQTLINMADKLFERHLKAFKK